MRVCVGGSVYVAVCMSIEPNVLHNFYVQQNKTATYRWICGDIGLFRKPLLSSSSSSSCVCCVEKEESDFLHCFSNFPFHFVSFFFSIFSLLRSFGPIVFVFRLLHSAHFCNNCNRMDSEHGRWAVSKWQTDNQNKTKPNKKQQNTVCTLLWSSRCNLCGGNVRHKTDSKIYNIRSSLQLHTHTQQTGRPSTWLCGFPGILSVFSKFFLFWSWLNEDQNGMDCVNNEKRRWCEGWRLIFRWMIFCTLSLAVSSVCVSASNRILRFIGKCRVHCTALFLQLRVYKYFLFYLSLLLSYCRVADVQCSLPVLLLADYISIRSLLLMPIE